jgi:ABC-type branched-subunit amino acid transport system substrate-binding protein
MRKFLQLGALVAGLWAEWHVCGAAPLTSPPAVHQPLSQSADILLGSSLVLTGPSELLGRELQSGAHAYFDRINAAGGVDGHHIRLIELDDHYEPQRAVDNTTRLINDEHVLAAVNYVGTATTTAALPILSSAGVALVGSFSGGQSLREPFNRFMFNTRASYRDEGTPLAHQLLTYGKVALFIQDDAFGESVRDSVTRGLAKYGLAPVVITTVKRNASGAELRAAAASAADAIGKSGAGAVAIGSLYPHVAALRKALRDRSLHVVLASVSTINTSGVLQEMKGDAAGMGIVQVFPNPYAGTTELARDYRRDVDAWHTRLVQLANTAPTRAEAEEFAEQARFARPSYGGLEGYINARLTVEGLRRCHGKLTSDSYRAALEDIGTIDLGGFTETFTRSSHLGSTWTDVTVVNGEGTRIVQ